MGFEPIRKQRVADQVAEAIREAILSGEYQPGDPLPSERDLAGRFGVNRSSVREALHRLEAWNLIEIRQGGATLVQDFLTTAGLYLLPHLIAPGGTPDLGIVQDLQEIRVMLMGWTARQAAGGVTLEALADLGMIVAHLETPDLSPEALRRLDFDFYQRLVEMSGNRVLALLSNAIREVYLERPDLFVDIYQPPFDVRFHREALEALTRGDGAAAARAMTAYARSAQDLFEPRGASDA